MKNVLITVFMLVVCVVGTLVAAAVYFGLTLGTLGVLFSTSPMRIGEAVGAPAGALGLPVGVLIFFVMFWDRLVRVDGRPDWFARGLGVVLSLPVALGGLTIIGPALSAVATFKAPGFLALAGFLFLAGWVEEALRRA